MGKRELLRIGVLELHSVYLPVIIAEQICLYDMHAVMRLRGVY